MLKVGLTGAHGVGKTTLCAELVKLLRDQGVNARKTPEVPREIIAEVDDRHFFRRGNNTLPRQLLILARQLDVERTNELSQVLICDRTLLDHWAYTLALFPHFSDPVTRGLWSNFVVNYLHSYGILLYLPIEIRAQDDGIREDNMGLSARN